MTGRLVAFAGRKGSGKSTASAFLRPLHRRIDLADPLKAMLREVGLTEEQLNGREKEAPIGWLDGITPRRMMQALGTEYGRDLIHPELWVRIWSRRVLTVVAAGGHVATSDVRFPNEAEAVDALGGRVLWIERPGLEADAAHPSERSIGPEDCAAVVINDGTLADFVGRVRAAVEGAPHEFRPPLPPAERAAIDRATVTRVPAGPRPEATGARRGGSGAMRVVAGQGATMVERQGPGTRGAA